MLRAFQSAIVFILVSFSLHAAHAGPVGKYEYSEKGFSGEMSVTEVSGCEIKDEPGCLSVRIYKIELVTVNKNNYHDCDVAAIENSDARVSSNTFIDALFVTKGNDGDQPKKLSVRFDQKGAMIKLESQDLAWLCGANANFTGRWRKTSK